MASAKLQGITMAPEQPQVVSTFLEVLDYKPAFQVVALFSPVGLLDEPPSRSHLRSRGASACSAHLDASAVLSAPACAALWSAIPTVRPRAANGGRLSAIGWRMLKRTAEVHEQMAPYWQRTIFEVHPELSFFQLNEDKPVRFSKHTRVGPGRATGAARRAHARCGTDHRREDPWCPRPSCSHAAAVCGRLGGSSHVAWSICPTIPNGTAKDSGWSSSNKVGPARPSHFGIADRLT